MNQAPVPLCVQLDRTLTPIDTGHEALLSLCRQSPAAVLRFPVWLAHGVRCLRQQVAARVRFDAETLPLRPELLAWLSSERAKGRRLVLVTNLPRDAAGSLAARMQIFDELLLVDVADPVTGDAARRALVARFGEQGFDYLGDDPAAGAVWKSARAGLLLEAGRLRSRDGSEPGVDMGASAQARSPRVWLKAIRLHQWVKNVLVFLPALLAHRIGDPPVFLASLLAFVAFGLCASSVYVVNDLLDLSSDRRHPRKRLRPFASGVLSARSGLLASSALLATSVLLAATVNRWFCLSLAAYYFFTWLYTLQLKRAAIVDVMALAGLYTLRIIAGAAATTIEPSFWLLAFSIFIFLSLGIVKRFAELDGARQAGRDGGYGRGYSSDDLSLLMSLGIAAGYSAVVVMALYINSADSQALYKHNKPLWLICPLMLYWISRIWLLTSRGQMEDDPVVFAVRDRISLAVLGLIGFVVFVSL